MQERIATLSQAIEATQAGPVELDASLLSLVSGGGPNGTWSTVNATAYSSNAVLSLASVVADGPNGTW